MKESIFSFALSSRKGEGPAPALVTESHTVSWQDLISGVEELSGSFERAGLRPGDAVGIALPNSHELIFLLLAVSKIGAVPLLIDPQATPSQFDFIFRLTKPRWVFGSSKENSQLRVLSGGKTEAALLEARERSVTIKEISPHSLLMFSSGSTGSPKPVLLTAAQLSSTNDGMAAVMKPRQGHRELLISPAVHMDGLQRLLMTFRSAGALFLYEGLPALSRIAERLECEKIQGVYLPPPVVKPFAQYVSGRKLARLEHIETGSAVHHADTLLQLGGSVANVYVHYGLTECSRATILDVKAHPAKVSSIGKPAGGVQIKVVDENFSEVSAGETGQILIRDGQTISEYLWGLHSDKFNKNWFCTGDFGYFDEDGFLYFKGRHDDMITRGGYHFYPAEAEAALTGKFNSDWEIADFLILATKKNESAMGDNIVLVVQRIKSAKLPIDQVKSELLKLIRQELPSHMRPAHIVEMFDLPRLNSGKIDRKALARLLG